MHFWIDKRSQACSISGRYRAPGSRHRGGGVSWGGGAGCCKVGGLVMVTPVHRFQPIESAQAGGGVRRAHHHRQRLLQHHGASLLQSHSSAPHAATSRLQAETSSVEAGDGGEGSEVVGSGRGGGGMSLLPQSGPGLAPQQQVLLRLPAPRREVLAVGRIKCGLWASLALISAFIAAAKFYVDNKVRGSGHEVLYLAVCALLLLLLVAGCIISLCSAGPPRGCFAARSAQTPSQNPSTPGPRSALIEIPEEEEGSGASDSLMLAQHTQPWVHTSQQTAQLHPAPATGGEPPPYHIAIWLPQPETPPLHIIPPAQGSQQEVPPPSYDKATS